jgi:hypothetical protein
MYLVLRIISEQQGELYSAKSEGTLSFIKEVSSINFNIKTDPIKAIIISTNLHFWKTIGFEKDLIMETKLFIFANDAISELDQIFFTPVNSSVELKVVTQAWIRRDKLSEIFEIWDIKRSFPIYPEALLRNDSKETKYIRSKDSVLAFQKNKPSADRVANKADGEIQSHISNLSITNDAKFIIPTIERRSLLTPLFCLLGTILLIFNIYCYSFFDKKEQYLVQTSKVQNLLGSISEVYAEFLPGSIKEIRIQDSGRNGSVTLLDEKFTTSVIEKKLSKKYFVELKNNEGLKILLLNERVLDND